MLKIRLRRMGKKHQPFYRIVITEHTAPVQGKYLVKIGHYNPFTKGVVLDKKAALEWMNKGAKPSNTVAKLFQKQGVKHKSIVIKKFRVKTKKELEEEKNQKEKEKTKEMAEKEANKIEFEAKVEEKKTAVEQTSEPDATIKETVEK